MTPSTSQAKSHTHAGRHANRPSAWRAFLHRILWCEPFWIVFLMPALLFPGRFWVTELHPILVVLLFAFWPLRLLAGGSLWRRTPLDWVLAALLAAVGMAVALSPAPASSWEAAGYLLLGVAMAMAMMQWPPLQTRPERAAWLLLAFSVPLALAGPGLLEYAPNKLGLDWLLPDAGNLSPILSESINPNVLGGALLTPALLALALAIGPRWSRLSWRVLWALTAVGLIAELLLTQSRGAYLGLAAGCLLLVLLRWPVSRWLLLPLVAVGLVLMLLSGGLALAFDAIGAEGSLTGVGVAGKGLAQRLLIWQSALVALQQQPLTGIGIGLFGPWVYQNGLLEYDANWQPHAHNLLLQVAADLGLPGLIAYTALLLIIALMLAVLVRRHAPRRRRRQQEEAGATRVRSTYRLSKEGAYRLRLHWSLAAGCAASLAGLLVHGQIDAALWGNKAAFQPWLLFALICLLLLRTKEDQATGSSPVSEFTHSVERRSAI